MSVNDSVQGGETVNAVLTDAETGRRRLVGSRPEQKKYHVKVIVTDLETNEITSYEVER